MCHPATDLTKSYKSTTNCTLYIRQPTSSTQSITRWRCEHSEYLFDHQTAIPSLKPSKNKHLTIIILFTVIFMPESCVIILSSLMILKVASQ